MYEAADLAVTPQLNIGQSRHGKPDAMSDTASCGTLIWALLPSSTSLTTYKQADAQCTCAAVARACSSCDLRKRCNKGAHSFSLLLRRCNNSPRPACKVTRSLQAVILTLVCCVGYAMCQSQMSLRCWCSTCWRHCFCKWHLLPLSRMMRFVSACMLACASQ